MKRHPFLEQLSREHHHGLVLARRARRWAGRDAATRASGWSTVRRAYASELEPHFQDEEVRVLPRLSLARPDLVGRAIDDHARLRALAQRGSTAEELDQLGVLLIAHIRWEERELFPAVEQLLAGADGDDTAVDHLDLVWARLPFLVPMAAKIARTSCAAGADRARLANLVEQLHTAVLDHLDREASILARLGADRDDDHIVAELEGLRREHRAMETLLRRVMVAAALPDEPADDACATVRAFYDQLRRVDEHLRAHIRIEDEIFSTRWGRCGQSDKLAP